MKKYDYIIVGSGLYGCVFAYLAKQKNKKVMIIEKRNHPGGNCFCELKEDIIIHKYGAHIFHTSDKEVWDFVNQFVKFNNFINSPIANYKGQLYNLPFNMNTFKQMWNITTAEEAKHIIENQKKDFNFDTPQNLEEYAINSVGYDIYNKLIKEYTEKQWQKKCTELPCQIISRLPLRFTYNNNYFDDCYQGIPVNGYNELIYKLIDGIELKLNTDFFNNKNYFLNNCTKLIYTGQIDKFFNYSYGKLEYRSLLFDTQKINIKNFQNNAVINYTSKEVPYTRIIEHKHFLPNSYGFEKNYTFITKEYPTEYSDNKEPYYPINTNNNIEIYKKYYDASLQESNILFGGRLAEYKYYDMDDVIKKALLDAKNELEKC